MNVLKQQLAWIQQQLSQLTASQKMLAAALAALMFVTIVYWGKYAGTPDLVAVTETTYPPERIAAIQGALTARGITSTAGSDGRIMVAADQRMQAFATLAWGKMLPANSSAAIDKIVGQMTLWDSAAKTEKLWTEQKQVVLGQMMSSWPDVETAEVILAVPEHRSLSMPTEPRATVNITLKEGVKPNKNLALTTAEFMTGSLVGLTRSNVKVTINGAHYRLPSEDDGGIDAGGDILTLQQQWDKFFTDKIERSIVNCGNSIVSVNISLDLNKTVSKKTELDPKNTVDYEHRSTEKTDQSTVPGPSGEPGTIPNTGASVGAAGGGGGGAGTSNKENTEETKTAFGQVTTDTAKPAGNGTVTSAAIQVPYSHFVGIWKNLNPKATNEPEEPLLQPLMTAEFDNVRAMVMSATGITDPKKVSVMRYYESEPMVVAAKPTSAGQVIGIVNGYGKEIGLSALALVSLLMVSGIVKKGAAPMPTVNSDGLAAQKRELESIMNGGATGGIASPQHENVSAAEEGSTALEALELDEETNQTQQMVAQVTNLVKENPDGAVSLVKRWLNRQ